MLIINRSPDTDNNELHLDKLLSIVHLETITMDSNDELDIKSLNNS